ncbi:MAG TPA: hypothetical protein VGC09_00445 [Rhodopila sp.]
MVATVSFNPYVTTTADGSFQIDSHGYIQGCAMDAPAMRYNMRGGVLAASETRPMWGGVGICETVRQPGSATSPIRALGGTITRATTLAAGANGTLTGFSVFDQLHSAIQTPQSPVPLVGSGNSVHFYPLGSGMRVPVACDPALDDLWGEVITSQVSWDFLTQRLIPYAPATAQETISSLAWAAGTVTATTSAAHGYSIGQDVVISSAVPAAYNGSVTILTVPSSTTFTYALAANPGAATAPGVIAAGGGALPVRVLDVQTEGNMVVDYDPTTGFARWDRNSACALIQI